MIFFIKCTIYRLCLNIKVFENSSLTVRSCSPDIQLWVLLSYYGWCWGTSIFLFFLFDKDSFFFLTGIAVWIVARYCRVKSSCRFCCCDGFRCFVCFFFPFLVVGLVLQRGCVYLLLDVDAVRYSDLYCFCPPCCDHCDGLWAVTQKPSQQQNLQEDFTRQYHATIQRAIPVRKHNYPYQIGKIEVPQHQP